VRPQVLSLAGDASEQASVAEVSVRPYAIHWQQPHVTYLDSSRRFMTEVAMATAVRQTFSSQASPKVLAELRKIAATEGRQLQSVLDEALRDYIARKETGRPRRHVIEAFALSVDEFDALYRELAQ
jgi:hypothetical protein